MSGGRAGVLPVRTFSTRIVRGLLLAKEQALVGAAAVKKAEAEARKATKAAAKKEKPRR